MSVMLVEEIKESDAQPTNTKPVRSVRVRLLRGDGPEHNLFVVDAEYLWRSINATTSEHIVSIGSLYTLESAKAKFAEIVSMARDGTIGKLEVEKPKRYKEQP